MAAVFSIDKLELPLHVITHNDDTLASHSSTSDTDAFETDIEARDTFDEVPRCVICGRGSSLVYRHIIPHTEQHTWDLARAMGYVHPNAKRLVKHDPRNGLLMCPSDFADFTNYIFFIRYVPQHEKFVYVNPAQDRSLGHLHGKAVALSPHDRHAVYAALFEIHEARVRGLHSFMPGIVDIDAPIAFQDWIVEDGFVSDSGGLRHCSGRPMIQEGIPTAGQLSAATTTDAIEPTSTPQQNMPSTGDVPHFITLGPHDDITPILAAQHRSESWKQAGIELTDWSGTAEENIRKYRELVGSSSSEADA
ncbi:unnamed protein product [Peniophora sp. CBMAI 1063]|nr:unnamed protein product [Peniophora sp. CBMAI 1063]